jgi:hypothetical protein
MSSPELILHRPEVCNRYCAHTALVVYCAHTVLILYCAHTVLVVYSISTCPLPTTHIHLPLHINTYRYWT